jgi:hypothetical protein
MFFATTQFSKQDMKKQRIDFSQLYETSGHWLTNIKLVEGTGWMYGTISCDGNHQLRKSI